MVLLGVFFGVGPAFCAFVFSFPVPPCGDTKVAPTVVSAENNRAIDRMVWGLIEVISLRIRLVPFGKPAWWSACIRFGDPLTITLRRPGHSETQSGRKSSRYARANQHDTSS